MFATSNGGMLVNVGGSGIIFAAPKLSADPAMSAVAGTYSSFVFTNAGGADPASITLDSSGGRPLNCVLSIIDGEQLQACNGADGTTSGSSCQGGSGNCYTPFFFLGKRR